MTEAAITHESLIENVRLLLNALEQGQEIEAGRLLEEVNRMRDASLFQELGKLTRQLHEAISGISVDPRLASIAEQEIPDAKERLDFVITKTEEAAHRTISAVEQSIPIAQGLAGTASVLNKDWQRLQRREMEAEEFRHLSREISAYLDSVESDTRSIQGSLSDVLMAQDYQDITGQVIRRVIDLVQEVEDKLVHLVKESGVAAGEEATVEEGSDTYAEGPQVTSKQTKAVVSGQDEVDDLLSSLGF